MDEYIGILGILFFTALAWLFSKNKKKIPWRTVITGVILQFVIALFLLRLPQGRGVFSRINDLVVSLLSHAQVGAELCFGRLAVPPGETGASGGASLGFFLAFQGFPVIIFVAALTSVLYYLKIMPRIVEFCSRIFRRLLGLSGAESLVAVNNVFVGIESVFAVRPYILKMTMSELHLLLTAGMATLASSVLAFYAMMMKDAMPGIAGHLVSASLLSAPAAVVMAKLLYPETEKPLTLKGEARMSALYDESDQKAPGGVVEAAIHGAGEGVKMIFGIIALLIAFLGIVSLLNSVLGWGGGLVGIDGLSFEKILGVILYPAARLCGAAPGDAGSVASLWGLRAVATEVPAYGRLAGELKGGMDPRSGLIAAYGLCGFAHVAAMAIFIGGTSALAPRRRKDLARLGPRALLAANLACFQTAAVAGLCLTAAHSSLFGG